VLRILYTAEARTDLDVIWDYIANDNAEAADRFLDQLAERFQLLAANPLLGELQPLLADGRYRRFVYRRYVIYYHADENALVLVRILHGALDEKEQF